MTMTQLEANVPSQLEANIASAAQQLRLIIDEARRRHASNLSGAELPPASAAAFYDVQRHMFVQAHEDITLPPGLLPKAIALYHKIMRRLLRWYLYPMVEQQNHFNLATLRAIQAILNELQSARVEQHSQLSALSDRLAAIERTLAGK
ncbi:MAG: hypothetical protein U0559_11110 [Anaerolineae bacterium]